MRINTNNPYNISPTFSAWRRTVYKNPNATTQVKELAYRNDTSFFRDDLIWDYLVRFLKDKYQDVSKANVYNFACSNGSEAYSIIMKFLTKLGIADSDKFFPIIAKDIDQLAIDNAKSGSVPIDWFEKSKINLHTNNHFQNFFTKDFSSNWHDGETFFYCPSKELKERVQFSKGDILKEFKKIKPENSIVFARNFWPYLIQDIPKLISSLAEQMGKNSTLIIGGYDINGCKNLGLDLRMEFIKRGFSSTDDSMILEKF